MRSEHLEYFYPPPATFGGFGKPPLNDFGIAEGIALASVIASAAGSAISYNASQDQAKQEKFNAEARAAAVADEQKRSEAEFAENQRRALVQQKRERAQQMAALASTGVMTTTGSPLALLADTHETQQSQLRDSSYLQQLSQREMSYKRKSLLAQGDNDARNTRAQGIGNALGDLASTGYQAYKVFG